MMNLTDHPELADRLAAAYALGTLRAGARRRFESLARQSPTLRTAALAWQERLAAITELQPIMTPDPNVWKRIQNLLAAERGQQAVAVAPEVPRRTRGVSGWWRAGAVFAAAVAFAAAGVSLQLDGQLGRRDAQLAQIDRARATLARDNLSLASQLQAQPQVQYVAVLSDDRSTASVLVTFDPRHNTLTLKRLGGFQEGPDKSLQLWALPPSGGPRSLGVIADAPVVKLTAAEAQLQQAPALAVSLEPRGGVSGHSGPTGPVLFKGPLLQTP